MMLVEQRVEKFNTFELLIDALYNNMSQVFVLIGEKSEDLFNWHVERLSKQENKEF